MSLTSKVSKLTLKNKIITLPTKDIIINYTDSIDEIFDEMTDEDFTADERFPYFITIWESGPVLANWLISNIQSLDDKTVLELGSGTGVTGIAVATKAKKCILTDYEEYSITIAQQNANANGLNNVNCLLADWRSFPTIKAHIDIVICSDVLYEQKHVIPLFTVLKSYINLGAEVYISDPGRGHIDTLLSLMKQDSYKVKLVFEEQNSITNLRNIKIYQIKS